ncbi:MAG TPA: PEP-CTERM sorting domain-containing protein [Pirellulales bacterium]|jgi:hypothetical protein|nr:PEP-CTERM sorting domain-containing protein [Pirellulales bacterium]
MSIKSFSSHSNVLKFVPLPAILFLGICVSTASAQLIHRYSFTTDGSDSVGGPTYNLTPVNNLANPITFTGGQAQLNNPNFSGPGVVENYLWYQNSPSILPAGNSMTVEQWFTFTGSGFFTESYAFSDNAEDNNPPGQTNGQYLMQAISAPQPASPPGGANTGGSHVAQALNGYQGGSETDAFETTPGLGAGGGGYLDDGGTYMMATVIDGTAGTLSYYLYRTSDGLGGLQQSITAIPLSSYNFTDLYLGRSPFLGDNATSGMIDEFRIYGDAQSASQIAADEAAGPDVVGVPEPSSIVLAALGLFGLVAARSRKARAA